MNVTAIAIHGGAGPNSDFIKENEAQYMHSLSSIVQRGNAVLKEGGTALDAVTEAICLLENDPLFNAGKGSSINFEGEVSMDASVMDGKTLKAGAVVNQCHIANPIMLARSVMEDTPYVLLTGPGLDVLRTYKGWDRVPVDYFHTDYQLQKFSDRRKEDVRKGSAQGLKQASHLPLHGTVGAVALDQYGNIAAGTSTGGAEYCLPGRVSDSCVIGAGCYANNDSCAVSGTGDGEFLITGVVAHRIATLVELAGYSVMDACQAVIGKYPSEKCDMGVISIDRSGHIGNAFNSDRMHRAWIDTEGKLFCSIY